MYITILYLHLVMLAKEYKKWPFSGINFSGGFSDLFLEVLTGINSFLKFFMSFLKSIKFPNKKISTCVEVIHLNVCVKCTRKPLVCLYLENQMFFFLGNLILLKA